MEQKNTRLRNVGFITFFFSGICAISSGVVVRSSMASPTA